MKLNNMTHCIILLALTFAATPVSAVLACVPSDPQDSSCISTNAPSKQGAPRNLSTQSQTALVITKLLTPSWMKQLLDDAWPPTIQMRASIPSRTAPSIKAVALPKVPPVVAPAPPQGTGPSNALEANDTWQIIGPHTRVWYRIGGGPDRQHLDAWLDAAGASGIGFNVYAPDQLGGWSPNTLPKGRGTYNRSDNSHDLNWSGQAPLGGNWYVVVSNDSDGPIRYKVGTQQRLGGRENCSGPYWEYFPDGSLHLWPGYCP